MWRLIAPPFEDVAIAPGAAAGVMALLVIGGGGLLAARTTPAR